MNGENKKSWPDYESWEGLRATIVELPPRRFYFVVTILGFLTGMYLARESTIAFGIIAVIMLIFSTTVFLMQWKYEDDGQNKTTQPANDGSGGGEAEEPDEHFKLTEHDGSCSEGAGGLRTSLESEKATEGPSNRPR